MSYTAHDVQFHLAPISTLSPYPLYYLLLPFRSSPCTAYRFSAIVAHNQCTLFQFQFYLAPIS